MDSSQDFPSSRFDRSKVIAKTGLKIGKNYAKFHLQKALGKNRHAEARKELNRTNANELFKEFSKLRGTALKLAQGMSLDSSMLPEEFAEVLTQSQYAVPPINKTIVRTIVKKQLGDWPENIFADFEPEARAAASLGQVHKAITKDGQTLAVKIQYPNVRDTIKSDLSIARVVFNRMMNSEKADTYFEEVKSKLIEETDYTNEGRQIEDFHALYAGNGVITPRWIQEYSTNSILAMTWVDGIHMGPFLDRQPTQQERNHYGQLLWDFFHSQINDSCTVHADAHPGNYLFTEDGKLAVLDFGCVKTCPLDFFRDYMGLFVAHRDGDIKRIKALYESLEIFTDTSTMDEHDQWFFDYTLGLGKLFVSPYQNDFFDFGESSFMQDFNQFARDAAKLRDPRGSKHFIYVTRAHLGLYQMLMKLKANVDVRPGRQILHGFLKRHEI